MAKIYRSDIDVFGTPDKFPYVCTTYRVVEHFHWYTKFMSGPSELMPEMFVEIPVELAKEKGVANGEYVKVTSARGSLTAVAVVTKRVPKLTCNGKTIYTVGVPIHWGYSGLVTGPLANVLTPFVWDPNAVTPEYKGFLCNLEKAKKGIA